MGPVLCHEFGIMDRAPQPGERYDCYEPEKYRCIQVSDDDLQPVLEAFCRGKAYWHTLDKPEMGLAYCGVTLIPPESAAFYLELVLERHKLSALAALFSEAVQEQKYVIHFGI